MRVSEWVVLGYFVYLAIAAMQQRGPFVRRLKTGAAAAMAAAAVLLGARTPSALRDWLPALYILPAYYLTGRLFVAPAEHLEKWLMGWDRRLLGDPATRFASWPRPVVSALEVVYMCTFLVVPGGFGLLVAAGHAAVADRYWTLVVGADFAAFAPLSIFQTRPPWVLERKPVLTDPALHEFASRVVETVSIRVNTFPSGHTAVSLAVALGVLSLMPVAGTILLAVALSIGVACFVCRYHYVLDVVAGVLVALSVWLAVRIAAL